MAKACTGAGAMAEACTGAAGMALPSSSLFLKGKGLPDMAIRKMLLRCSRLSHPDSQPAMHSNWAFLHHHLAIPSRKLPSLVSRCPQLLVLDQLRPMADFLSGLGAQPAHLAAAILRFPHILTCSVEHKLCPLLAFLQGSGVPDARLAKVLISCPRLISYSIQARLQPMVNYLVELGITRGEEMGKLLTRWPHIFGYSVERRVRPTVEYLKNIGLRDDQIMTIASRFPHILCRDADRTFQPNVEFLHSLGFDSRQTAALVCGYPPILILSIKNSLQPKMDFLLKTMGRTREEVVQYPAFFGHSLSRKIEPRYRKLKQEGVYCSLESMLSCNQKKFSAESLSFGLPSAKLSKLMLNAV